MCVRWAEAGSAGWGAGRGAERGSSQEWQRVGVAHVCEGVGSAQECAWERREWGKWCVAGGRLPSLGVGKSEARECLRVQAARATQPTQPITHTFFFDALLRPLLIRVCEESRMRARSDAPDHLSTSLSAPTNLPSFSRPPQPSPHAPSTVGCPAPFSTTSAANSSAQHHGQLPRRD